MRTKATQLTLEKAERSDQNQFEKLFPKLTPSGIERVTSSFSAHSARSCATEILKLFVLILWML